ncbi:MAG: hypothetical protein LBR10_09710 [Prevotellaceae bacterium]|nr:hypothetical protein [Prevotellaceae bacterium]
MSKSLETQRIIKGLRRFSGHSVALTMLHNLQIQKLLVKASAVQSPYDRIKMVKEAVSIADVHNDIERGFDLRRELIILEKGTSSSIESFPAFTWMLEAQSQHPDLFGDKDLILQYKWMVHAAMRNAEVSATQLESIMEDYKIRLERNGFTLHSYYSARTHQAFMMNELDAAREYLVLRGGEKRDDLSFCEACEISDLVEYEFMTNNIKRAFRVGVDLFSGKSYCKYIPFQTICNSLNILQSNGYEHDAASLFEVADNELERMKNSDMSNIGYVGQLLHYLIGIDKERAWEYFERYVAWSIDCEDYFGFRFGSGALSLFKGSGARRLNVTSALPWHNSKGIYELPELYDYYKNQATALAMKFDARNGGSSFINELNNKM